MTFKEDGYTPIVKTKEDLEEAKKLNRIYVYAICPKCKDGWTSLISNAAQILEKGCLGCVDDEWQPNVEVIISKPK